MIPGDSRVVYDALELALSKLSDEDARYACAAAIKLIRDDAPNGQDDQEIVAQARTRYAIDSDDDVEIDDVPRLNRTADGCWVSAWVWVAGDIIGED